MGHPNTKLDPRLEAALKRADEAILRVAARRARRSRQFAARITGEKLEKEEEKEISFL